MLVDNYHCIQSSGTGDSSLGEARKLPSSILYGNHLESSPDKNCRYVYRSGLDKLETVTGEAQLSFTGPGLGRGSHLNER